MLSDRALAAFRAALGENRVFDDAAIRALYASDETPRRVTPDAVLFPGSHDDVLALVRRAAPFATLPPCALTMSLMGAGERAASSSTW